ncbi:MAG: hypothetical protein KJO75_01305 [Dactylosporangium sp.]|nr:hypothetical protein [Dactylosporangium sp.]
MSYKEKGAWVYLAVTGGTFAVYLAIILRRATTTPLAEVSYAPTMLWTIGISIVVSILGHIAVTAATTKPADCHAPMTDVRDQAINRFGEYVAGIVLAAGMVVPLGLAMAEVAYFWIANAIYTTFVLSTLAGLGVRLFTYRRGL